MKTIQMTLEENLLLEVDHAAKQEKSSRSAFIRQALRAALDRLHQSELERRHRQGYLEHPVQPGEFSDWENEQVWVD